MGAVENFSALAKAINDEKSRVISNDGNSELYVSRELTDAVQAYFTGVLEKLQSIRTSVDELAAAIGQTEFRVRKIRCQIPALADKQFIENCIAEEKTDKGAEETRSEDSEKLDHSEAENFGDLAKEAIDSFLKVFPNEDI